MRYSNDPKDIGAKLGPKLVKLISDTIVATKLKLLDTEHRARVHSMQTIIDRAGAEIADLYRPVWEDALAQQEMPDVIRDHINKIMSGRHQWQAIAGIAFGASGAPNALSTIISNYLAPSVRAVVGRDPELVPAAEVGAQMAARFIVPQQDAISWSTGQGFNGDITAALIEAARAYPDVVTALELWRRGIILPQDVQLYLSRAGYSPDVAGQLMTLATQILSPADLADMVVRGIKPQADAAKIAAMSGITAADFNSLTLLTGEPPGLQQMLEGYRRGFIDRATLERGIRQSRYRDEWIPLLEQLRYEPMSVADAVNATVQNHMTRDQAAQIADFNGLMPGAIDTLLETAGEPLSRTEMSELVNRGQATEADFVQAMRESRVKDKYIPYAFELRRKLIPPREIVTALEHGAVDQPTAVQKIMEDGYSAEDAHILVASGVGAKLTSHKANIVTAIEAAYEAFLIPRTDALTLIEQMGYDQAEAEFVLQGADFRQSARIVTHAVNAVHSRYVAHRIDRNTASGDLDALGVPASQRDFLLHMWDVEVSANVKVLTEAQIVKAVNKNLINPDDGQARLVALGYSPGDAMLLLQGA